MSENEVDLPVAMDCTTLTLVEAAQSNPASLLAENQDHGVEPKDCHVRVASRREGTDSAAPIAQNEKSLNSAIANQTQRQAEQDYSALLLVKNSVSGVEVKAVDDEGEGSAAPVPSAEKWSHEAIVARSNMRPERIQKLTRCGEFGAESGF